MLLSFCLPCIEPKEHNELCFLSHPMCDRRVQCNIFGHITMDTNWKGWEVWRFIRKNDNTFVITSWTHDRKVLCSNPEGRVYTTENKEGSWERWRITKHPKTEGLLIQSVDHGRYLAFCGQHLFTANNATDEEGRPTAWHLEPGHGNQFFISSPEHNKRVSSGKDRNLFTQENRKPWEKWTIVPKGTMGSFTVRSLDHGHYLGSDDGGSLCIRNDAEEWAIVSSPHYNGMFLQSKRYQHKRLACDDNGHLYLSEATEGWETWNLEPIMPFTISDRQIWSWVGIGASTIVLAVAAPFAVIGVVGAIGFGSGGIAAGSIAAGMMSAEAIACGGTVAAGGTVATLQSIGAAGLGAAAVTASVGAGATVGGVASASVASAARGLDPQGSSIEMPIETENLPLCSWRHW